MYKQGKRKSGLQNTNQQFQGFLKHSYIYLMITNYYPSVEHIYFCDKIEQQCPISCARQIPSK